MTTRDEVDAALSFDPHYGSAPADPPSPATLAYLKAWGLIPKDPPATRPADAPMDSEVLDAIATVMSGREWSPDTLDTIADCVRLSGRIVADLGPDHYLNPDTIDGQYLNGVEVVTGRCVCGDPDCEQVQT